MLAPLGFNDAEGGRGGGHAILCHGDAVGADAEARDIAVTLGWKAVSHPSANEAWRAHEVANAGLILRGDGERGDARSEGGGDAAIAAVPVLLNSFRIGDRGWP